MPTGPLLEARALRRSYGTRVAVDQLSFAIRAGEIFGFLGPNGAGKTTTFEMLSGLRRPDSGDFLFHGQPVQPTDPRYRAHLGVVFQKPSLDDKLTVRENLALGAALYGVTGRSASPLLDQALVAAELDGRAHEAAGKLSGGLKRRLELARVLVHRPDLLVLDEPTQGLDPAFFRRFWAGVRALRGERGLAVLVTTHDAHEAEECDRLAILDQGRAIAEGSPAELKARIGGDVVTLEAARPEELVEPLKTQHGVEATVVDGKLVFARAAAHELVPRLVESLPPGRLASVAVRPPNLADVFVRLTGRALRPEAAT